MLIYAKHYGQMCNRLWALLPVLAYALEKKSRLYLLFAHKDYVDCFPMLKKCPFLSLLFTSNNIPKWAWRVNHFAEKYKLEVEGDLREKKHLPFFPFVDGWLHSDDVSYVMQHKAKLIKLFQPSSYIQDKIHATLGKFEGVTVGVHIRRGDYQTYLGGKYFYDDEIYGRQLLNIKKQIENKGKQCRFLICSNAAFDWNNQEVEMIRIPHSDGVTDLYGLSQCDYIIGPPSSYSQWASFVGNVPISFLLTADYLVSLDDFSPVIKFNVLMNGKRLFLNNELQKYELK